MSIGKDARTCVMHYITKAMDGKASKAFISRCMVNAKSLLNDGFTADEIIAVIDYSIDVKKLNIFSFGFYNASIDNLLREVKQLQLQTKTQEQSRHIASFNEENRDEVQANDDSTERNRNKSERFGVQSRLGEKLDFDMLTKS